jgi:tRNA(Leu) C34 or U34 (ribose-2'-O)-methylase TrmL
VRGYSAVGLFCPKTNYNVGSVLRAAGCFDSSLIVVQGRRYQSSGTDTQKQVKHIPMIEGNLKDCIPYDCVPVAVDLVEGAQSLHSYTHPERAFYIFGPEDGTLGKDVTSWCRDTIYIPASACLNLAAAVNVVLYDRDKKRSREERLLDRPARNGWKEAA